MQMYYATDMNNVFCQEQYINAVVDKENMQVTFRLDKSLCGHLTGMRFDFTAMEDLVGIKSVTLSSAGVVQEEYNPAQFFAPANIAVVNGVEISLIETRNQAYIATEGNDPFVVMSSEIVSEIDGGFSHYRMTRVWICVFVAVGIWLWRKNIFVESYLRRS